VKVYLKKISFQEFAKDFYKNLKKMFITNEQRDLDSIEQTYKSDHEDIYKIRLEDGTVVGFFMLEKLPDCPYYLDYYTIYKKYQDKGLGSAVLKTIINEICGEDGICAEIEKVDENNEQSLKRWEFYKRLGFRLVNSELYIYYVLYNPIICSSKKYTTREIVRNLFKYYNLNCEEDAISKYCKIKYEGENE